MRWSDGRPTAGIYGVRARRPRLGTSMFHDFHQVRHLGYHAANGGGVRTLNHLVQPGKPQAFDHQLVCYRGTNRGAHPLQVELAAAFIRCLGHGYSSSADLPRMAATSCRFFNFLSASKVALTTLCGLVVPIDLVSTFCTPAEVMTARTAPPAITPVPSGAGLSKTIPEPNRPITVCGIEVCVRFTRTRFFFADSIPLRIAWGTSFAFPEPYPTTAALGSPTTTSAAKERFLPPLTTLVTRLIATT